MKYSVTLLALAAVAFALPQEASSITSAPVASASLDPYTASLMSCVSSCDAADVTCQAQCVGVARPNSSQVVETNECAAKCDQGDGSKQATDDYAKCQSDCFASLFPSSQTLAPAAGGASSGSAKATGSAGSNSASAGEFGLAPALYVSNESRQEQLPPEPVRSRPTLLALLQAALPNLLVLALPTPIPLNFWGLASPASWPSSRCKSLAFERLPWHSMVYPSCSETETCCSKEHRHTDGYSGPNFCLQLLYF